ncbi:lipopolysaccharide kinase InaA family protein [Sporohalobacter salinus]|uniref:lipopolysaccharide kinase InaA family protein n=1 Tax=Sporohalobacter salinus TaxID=1494606 RepID=UPI0019601B10|nr:lipopolysaccharide kinase InaA family protein [Sporohalobacter salinus]MBM7622952.1 tRNA A-37 threonylcarbamoyl transferase component Bud32 [Sporohalobacter salinus]
MELDYTKEKDEDGTRLIWIAEGWDNNEFRSYLDSFDRNFKKGNAIYDKRNLLTKVEFNKELGIKKDIAVKKFKLTRTYDKFRFCFLDSKAVRSLRIALALQDIGVKTPKPVAVVEKRGRFNKLLYSYFITEYVDYDYNLLDIAKDYDHSLRNKLKDWLPQIAQDVKKMHEVGIVHNDLHAGNILVKITEDNPQFYYIDLNRGRIKSNLSRKQKVQDLARFKFTSEEQEIFMEYYAPNNYRQLLDLMIKQRKRRQKFRECKEKLRRFVSGK